jgi:ATP-dependent helicase/nuclease subunit A
VSNNWTSEQSQAITTTGNNLLVSAAAGSGKTAVLAARCAYLICDANPPCDATELLVVTFTNAAAEEMRRRIAQLILQRASEKSDDKRLQRQAILIHAAQISTIHSLGQTIIRRHFHELGIDPHFRIMDEDESQLLKTEVVHQLVEKKLTEETSSDFRHFVEQYARGQPRVLSKIILELYNKLRSVINPDQWLAQREKWLREASEKPISQSSIGQRVIRYFSSQLHGIQQNAECLLVGLSERNDLNRYRDYVRAIVETIQDWYKLLQAGAWNDLSASLRAFEFDRLPTVKAPDREQWKNRVNQLKNSINQRILQSILILSEDQLRRDVQHSLQATSQITSLLRQFNETYSQAKHESGCFDFADLEYFTLELLKEPGSDPPAPSRIALEYQNQFRHVLVDEYQDINPLQDAILSLLGGKNNHFVVGDVKQSIYRFRQADPQRFIQRYNFYQTNPNSYGRVIHLQRNFRSRKPLLEILNVFFHSLMTEDVAEINYDDSHHFVPGANYYSEDSGLFAGQPVELHIAEEVSPGNRSDLDRDEREALIAALRVRQLLGMEEHPRAQVVNKDGTTRPIEPSDIVILLRVMKIKAERFASILRRCGIPVQADSTSGFFKATEVGDVLSVLQLLVNRRNDLALAAFLRSPMSGWTTVEDLLARIRLTYPSSRCPCFHQAYNRYGREKEDELSQLIRSTNQMLDRWRTAAQYEPVSEVIRLVLQDTAYLSFISGLPDGPQRVANVEEILRRARQFESFQRPTLARFLEFLKEIEDENDLGMPTAAGAASNAVRIMSIHKSKGLEFPVVILPDLSKKHNLRDTQEFLLFDDSVGIAARRVDLDKEIHYPTLAITLAANELRRKLIAEELRVLYVALTRAKEHLILIGTSNPDCWDRWFDHWHAHHGPLPADDILQGSSMLDWIGPAAVLTQRDRPGSIENRVYTSDEIDRLMDSLFQKTRANRIDPIVFDLKPLNNPPDISDTARNVISRLEYRYPYPAARNQSAVTSVTQLTKSEKLAPGGKSVTRTGILSFSAPLRFSQSVSKTDLSSTDLGSINHTVLERLHFSRIDDADSLETELDRLVAHRFLTRDELPYVDRPGILWWIGSDLGQRLRHASDVRRELSITFTRTIDTDSCQLVRGRLDVVIVEPDGLTIIDYKTDNVNEQTVRQRAEFYREQINTYRSALADISGQPVKEAYLVFLKVRKIIRM